MTKVCCKSCVHFRQAPYEAPHTGCWHPDNMRVTQKESYLDQQQLPGDHEKINLRHDCAQYEQRAARPSIFRRMLGLSA